MPRAVAINVAANTTLPGFRGPVFPDGTFTYVPIPERQPTDGTVPTYGDLVPDLDLPFDLPADLRDRRVHLDPAFADYPCCDVHSYGDEHGVKAGPISALDPGDYLFFYATLTTYGEPAREWVLPEWGAYLVGCFRIAGVYTGEEYGALESGERSAFAGNAHVKREAFDAKVVVRGDPDDSGLFDRAVPLSVSENGSTANRVVTDLAGDSGKGPWWRRVLTFGPAETEEVLALRDDPGAVLG